MNIMTNLNNYNHIAEIYKLPYWFDYVDIDWIRYYAMKNKKEIRKPTKESIERGIFEDNKYIYSNKQYDTFEIFRTYLAYLNCVLDKEFCSVKCDITEDEMKQLLSIKICDYDWYFLWSNPEFDKNSDQLLLRKKADIDYTKYKYVSENYKLPDWAKCGWRDGKKNSKTIVRLTEKSIKKGIVEDKQYIYSNELYDMVQIFRKYLAYIYGDINYCYPDEDITDDQIKQLLSIKISDFDWNYDFTGCRVFRGSNVLIFKKITDDDEYVDWDYHSD